MNILTFDIEDWFILGDKDKIDPSHWNKLESRIVNNVSSILELLSVHQTTATFFIQGWIAENYPELVKAIFKEGHEIGYHSYAHNHPCLQDKELFRSDLLKGLSILKEITGEDITFYRAPYFGITNESLWIYPILAKYGIEVSSSVKSGIVLKNKPVTHKPLKLVTKFGTITEYPLNRFTSSLGSFSFSGSGYFRLLPYFIHKKLFSTGPYNMAYFHPRDFDLNTPYHPSISCFRHWKMSVNASTTESKLNKLLSYLLFHPLGEAHLVLGKGEHETIFL